MDTEIRLGIESQFGDVALAQVTPSQSCPFFSMIEYSVECPSNAVCLMFSYNETIQQSQEAGISL